MNNTSQEELEALALNALYKFMNERGGYVTAHSVCVFLDNKYSIGRVSMALDRLDHLGFVHGSYSAIDDAEYQISDQGYKHAEEIAFEAQSREDAGGSDRAPASDRIVGFDHNSSEFKKVLDETGNLKAELEKANDVGDMSSRAVDVAKHEVADLERNLLSDFIRPAHIWKVAKSTLQWIGEKSAGAIVGQIALGLLALLAALFGISFV